jgi:hypothetical protein
MPFTLKPVIASPQGAAICPDRHVASLLAMTSYVNSVATGVADSFAQRPGTEEQEAQNTHLFSRSGSEGTGEDFFGG